MNGSSARRGWEIKTQMVYESLTGIFGSLSLKPLCFNQSFHCHNLFFFCLTSHQPAPLFIIVIADSVCSFFIFIMISTKFFTHTHSPLSYLFLSNFFFSIPFAVSEQLVFFSLLFSTCQDYQSNHSI